MMPPNNRQFEQILAEQKDQGERLRALETQVGRIISDIESEKGTRDRQDERLENQLKDMGNTVSREMKENAENRDKKFNRLEQRTSKLEKIIYLAAGAITILQPFAARLVNAVLKLVNV